MKSLNEPGPRPTTPATLSGRRGETTPALRDGRLVSGPDVELRRLPGIVSSSCIGPTSRVGGRGAEAASLNLHQRLSSKSLNVGCHSNLHVLKGVLVAPAHPR